LLESVNEAVALVSREQVRGASWSAETLARAVIDDAADRSTSSRAS
jgi:translation initiation factor eIF-2B subunit delta